MRIFRNIHDPFINPEFCSVMSKYVPLRYVDNIPTFDGNQTFFWSMIKFNKIKKQHIVDAKIKRPLRYFFVKYPATYENTFKSYNRYFRNRVRKAIKNNLIVRVFDKPPEKYIRLCYDIYDKNMQRMNTLSFPYEFFRDLCNISYSRLYVVVHKNRIISFALLLGNFMFLQSSNEKGRELCANNLLYDKFYHDFENEVFYLGIASGKETGLHHFKISSGAKPIPASPTYFDFKYHLPKFLRKNFLMRYLLRKIDKKKMFKHLFPY